MQDTKADGGDQPVTTLCRMCEQGCGLEVSLGPDGRPVQVKGDKNHPYSRGWLCVKGLAALDFFNSPRRLTTPLIRRDDGRLHQASWEETLHLAARELHRLRDTYGPQCLAIYHGEGVGHQEIKSYMKRFANVYGTPNFMGVGSLCNAARTMADTLTLGQVTRPDIANTRFLFVWGGSPLVSNEPTTTPEMRRLARRSAVLAVVDPRRTSTARLADYHLAVRPGSDGILAANVLQVILREGLWDRPFAEAWIKGFPLLKEAGDDRFSPESGERQTGVPSDLVRQVAVTYASTKPACLLVGNGLEHHGQGVAAMRLLALLKALTGNLDMPGGDLFSTGPRLRDISTPLPPSTVPPLGSDTFPLFCRLRQEAQALSLPEAILEGRPYPIRGLIIAGGNPSLHWQYRYLPRLRSLVPEPRVEIHPRTARQYGLADGDLAEVETPVGRLRLKACLTDGIRPDTLHLPQGWEEANPNELTGTEDPDPVSGFPNLKSGRCRIRKISAPKVSRP